MRNSIPDGVNRLNQRNRFDGETQQAQSRSFGKDAFLPILVCLLSGLGSWAGIMLTAQFSTSAYQQQKAFDWETRIFDKRVECIERMARLIAKQPGVHDEWTRYLVSLKPGGKEDIPPSESSQKLSDYNAEYLSALLLAKLYSGAETINAVNALTEKNTPWWMKPQDKQFEVLSAMSKELGLTLPTINSTLNPNK